MPVLEASQLQRKGRRFCCREYPKCSRDDFKTPMAENMHYIRSHSRNKWNLPKGKTRPSTTEKSNGSPTIIASVLEALKKSPDGLSLAELSDAVKTSGVKSNATDVSMRTYIASVIRSHQDRLGITQPKRGMYTLSATEDTTKPRHKGRGKAKGKKSNKTTALAIRNGISDRSERVSGVIDPAEELISLRHRVQIQKTALMKVMEAVFLMAE